MSYQVTLSELASMEDPGFLLDVTLRDGGRLVCDLSPLALEWDEAIKAALVGFEKGFTVEISEHEAHPGDAHDLLPGEIDRQD